MPKKPNVEENQKAKSAPTFVLSSLQFIFLTFFRHENVAASILNFPFNSQSSVSFKRSKTSLSSVLGLVFFGIIALFFANDLNSPTFAQERGQVVFFSIPIGTSEAPIFAAPDENSYRTGAIPEKRFVEVYFRTESGWCAIRPPQGCFSWINGKFVRLESESVGRVVSASGKAIPARVGAVALEQSVVVQVGLKNDQKLKILEKTTTEDGAVWYKIAPPPGEFRWIRESDLISDPALEKLPFKLMFQKEYLEYLDRQASTSVAETVPATNSNAESLPEFDLTLSNSNNNATSQQNSQSAPASNNAEFKLAVARLNADVFQAIRETSTTDEQFALLAARAETLFDSAPNDDERVVVQSIFNALKIEEKRRDDEAANGDATLDSPLYLPDPTTFESSESAAPATFETFETDKNVDAASGGFQRQNASAPHFAPQEGRHFNGFNGNAVVVDPSTGEKILYEGFASSSEAPQTPQTVRTNASKPRLEFAFSSANNPLSSRKSRDVRIIPNRTPSASNSPKLPPLFPSGTRLIVPPPNYRSNPFGQTTRRNERLIAVGAASQSPQASQLTESENTTFSEAGASDVQWRAVAESSAPPETVSTTAGSPIDSNSANSAVAAISPIRATVPPSAVVSSNSRPNAQRTDGSPKIRQTNAFEPISIGIGERFDAIGTLAALTNASSETPRFALVRPNGTKFDVVSYLAVAPNGVSLDEYVGKKVGVKGTTENIVIDGATRKLIVVRAILPTK